MVYSLVGCGALPPGGCWVKRRRKQSTNPEERLTDGPVEKRLLNPGISGNVDCRLFYHLVQLTVEFILESRAVEIQYEFSVLETFRGSVSVFAPTIRRFETVTDIRSEVGEPL